MQCRGDNVRKQIGILLFALVVAVGFSGTAFAQPVHTQTVSIQNHAFHPKIVMVKSGDTVTWVNKDHEAHTVTSVNRKFRSSGHINPGAYYRVTFTKSGAYLYYCSIHPYMKGVVVVRR